MNRLLIIFLFCACSLALAEDSKHKALLSLSEADIEGYLNGEGMGQAKAAELNGYPGPLHVLELSDELDLNEQQKDKTQELFNSMNEQARHLGKQVVELELELNRLFAESKASKESLEVILSKLANTKAQLKETHLLAHIEMKLLLNRHQVMMYNQLRGYSKDGHHHHH